ncbi:hypothetical protein J623_3797 [Acinetobacter sp. 1245249]|nr:hypothetical protein J623_3797 [Acinetobacter sp. 1245249]
MRIESVIWINIKKLLKLEKAHKEGAFFITHCLKNIQKTL